MMKRPRVGNGTPRVLSDEATYLSFGVIPGYGVESPPLRVSTTLWLRQCISITSPCFQSQISGLAVDEHVVPRLNFSEEATLRLCWSEIPDEIFSSSFIVQIHLFIAYFVQHGPSCL